MNKSVFLITGLVLVIITLSLVQVVLVNQVSTTGEELVRIEKELHAYKKENFILKEQYLEASALSTISTKAKHMGLVTAQSQLYLSIPLPLALNQ